MKKCYVYQIKVDGVPRYIGKGTGDRFRGHMKMVRRLARLRSSGQMIWATRFYNKLTKAWLAGSELEFEIVVAGLTDAAAFKIEIEMISNAVGLWNEAPGGAGFSTEQWKDKSFRKKMKARDNRKKSKLYRRKRSQISKRTWDTKREELIKAIWNDERRAKLAKKREDNRKQRLSKWLPYSSHNEWQRAQAVLRREQREFERKERRRLGLTLAEGRPKKKSTQFTSETARIVQLASWRDPKSRAKRLTIYGSDEYREKMSAALINSIRSKKESQS